jgi:hypothetical protein
LDESTSEQHEPSLTEPEHRGLKLWLSWMAANFLVGIIFILPVVIIASLPDYNFSDDNAIGPFGLCGVDLLVGSFAIAYCQSQVLQRFNLIQSSRSWLISSFLGFIAAVILFGIVNSYSSALAGAFVAGTVLGTIEWFVLVFYFRKAAWWILTNAVSWGIGVLILQLTNATFLPSLSTSHYDFPFRPTEAVTYWVGSFAAGVIVYGLLTGATLVWFFRASVLNYETES